MRERGAGALRPAHRAPDRLPLRRRVGDHLTPADRRLLLVHAHPDDETITCGSTMARYVAEGASVTLLTCTLGEEGEILVPALAGLAADAGDQLGGYRIVELERACTALGVIDHRFLGGAGRFRDSGMMGTPANDVDRCFWRADPEQIAGLVAEVVREIRPHVVVTYDENGGYGHPDHIQAHRATMAGIDAAAADWAVSKVYWTALPHSSYRAGVEAVRAAGLDFDLSDPEDDTISVADELVTTVIEAAEHFPAKQAAMRAHATQISVDGSFFALSNGLGRPLAAVEHFRLVRGERGPGGAENGWETDLFAGL